MPVDDIIATYTPIVVVVASEVPPGFTYFELDVPRDDLAVVGYFHLDVANG